MKQTLENNLFTRNPKLAEEWHPLKNEGLTPADVTAGSGKKAWWLGKCGHEWQSKVYSRNQGIGCPICSGFQVLEGFNDFATKNPELSEEWHPTKNGSIMPNDVASNSHKVVWWLGKCEHEWQSNIYSRKAGNGCPICRKESISSFPEQAIFFYLKKVFVDTKNTHRFSGKLEIDIFIASLKLGIEYDGCTWHKNVERDKKKNLLCKQNNIVLIRIREPGCPILDDDTFCISLEDLTKKSLERAIQEIFEYITQNLTNQKYVIDIDINRDNASINSLLIRKEKGNNLFNFNPKLAEEWHPTKNCNVKPYMMATNSNRKVWWLGKCGHEWQATANDRNNKGSGCPYCSNTNKKILVGLNDLEIKNPELAKEWHPTKNGFLKSNMVTPYTNKKAWWLGKCGHEWESLISHRSNGSGCPYCGNGNKLLIGFNDLETKKSELAKEWHPTKNGLLQPNMVTVAANKKVWWVGKCGHEWNALISSRSYGSGCPICARKK